MQIRISGGLHRVYDGNTFLNTFRLKEWKHMDMVVHNCDAECPDPSEQTLLIFDLELVKRCRTQRFAEWLTWKPDDEDHKVYEQHQRTQHFRQWEQELREDDTNE